MTLSSIAVDDQLLIAGTVKAVDYSGGKHFDSVELLLDNPTDRKTTIKLDADNIGTDSATLAADIALLARWLAIGTACGMTISQLEAATIAVDGVTHVVTITPGLG